MSTFGTTLNFIQATNPKIQWLGVCVCFFGGEPFNRTAGGPRTYLQMELVPPINGWDVNRKSVEFWDPTWRIIPISK